MGNTVFLLHETDIRQRWEWNKGSDVELCLREISALRAEVSKVNEGWAMCEKVRRFEADQRSQSDASVKP